MKIQIVSDLHLEFRSTFENIDKFLSKLIQPVDALVLAGDICNNSAIPFIGNMLADKAEQVIYIAGNHEFYGGSFGLIRKQFETIKKDNFHFLDNSDVVIQGQRFLGSTMWYGEDPLNDAYRHLINDFKYINDFRKNVYEENSKAVKFLSTVNDGDIVITHHAPSSKSVSDRYKLNNANRFYICDMERLMGIPRLWIHGHTHTSFDYNLGNTRVICNPYGYFMVEENQDFDGRLII